MKILLDKPCTLKRLVKKRTMLCDYVLVKDDRRKPEPPLPRKQFNMAIVGKKGSGKTTTAYNLITNQYKRVFNRIYLVGEFSDIADSELADIPEDQQYPMLNEESINMLFADIQRHLDDDPHYSSLIFLDDCMSQLKGKGVEPMLTMFFANARHLHASIMLLTQVYNKLPRSARVNLDYLILFKTKSISELDTISSEVDLGMKPKELRSIMDQVLTKGESLLFNITCDGDDMLWALKHDGARRIVIRAEADEVPLVSVTITTQDLPKIRRND